MTNKRNINSNDNEILIANNSNENDINNNDINQQ